MVRPVSQNLLNQLANPGGEGFARLANTIQNAKQRQRQSKLMQMQAFQQFAPAASGIVDQALSVPQEQRDDIMYQKRELFENMGIRFDDQPGTFDDNSLTALKRSFQPFIRQQSMDQVQSSKQLPGGLVQLVYKSGKVETVPASELDAAQIESAENRGVELQGMRSQSRTSGSESAKLGAKAFTQSRQIKGNIRNLKNVIKAVGDGAETGPLAKKLPSFKAASIRLDNIRSNLGLDVIGSVTFGALSEGELQLALDTALPTGLQGPELVKWAQDKIDAQTKLTDYLERQAKFLTKPGNDIADWLEHIGTTDQPPEQLEPEQAPNVGRFTIEIVQ